VNDQLWWYVARAGGIVAWVLLALSVIWGLLLSTRLLGKRPTPAWLNDLHRYLGALALVFTAVHVTALVADSYVHFGPADVLVPMASAWKPGPTAWGVVSLYLLVAIEITSLLMRKLPRRLWRAVHLSSFGLFFTASIHGATAGTDATNPIYTYVSLTLIALAMLTTLVRVFKKPRRRRTRSNQRERPTAFMLQQPSLSLDAEAVPTKRTVAAHDAVARHDDPHRIRRVG